MVLPEVSGWRRVPGLLRYVGMIIEFSSLLLLLPALLSLYYDLSRANLSLVIYPLYLAIPAALVASCILFLQNKYNPVIILALYIAPSIALLTLYFESGVISYLTSTFMLFGVVLLGIGALICIVFRIEITLKLEEAVLLVSLIWILIPILIAIPVSVALHIHFIDAWFESAEGITGTGLTVFTGAPDSYGQYIPSVEQLPKPILFWRALIQWIGGVGIVVSSMAVLSRPGLGTLLLSQIEGRLERIEPSIRKTAIDILRLYTLLTVVAILLYKIAGMSFFDAVMHGMTGIATGGFSTKNLSIGEYHSLAIELVSLPIMILGASNFYDMYKGLKTPSRFLKSPEFKAMILMAFTASMLGASMLITKYGSFLTALRKAVFQVVSAMTNTGFQTMNIATSPAAFKYLLASLMLVGGSIFSTAGGFKVIRLLLLLKTVGEELKTITRPRGAITSYRVGRYDFRKPEVIRGLLVIALFITTTYVAFMYACCRLETHYSPDNIFFDTVSAITNTGLSAGVSGAPLSVDVKLLFILISTLGRLEILPMLVLIYKLFNL